MSKDRKQLEKINKLIDSVKTAKSDPLPKGKSPFLGVSIEGANTVVQSVDEEYRGEVSDGYHTYNELYEHRIILWIHLCHLKANQNNKGQVWRSKYHSDGTSYKGWFLLGINQEKGKQMTYHIPLKHWELCVFAETLDKAPEFDGHTPKDVVDRLFKIEENI